MYMSILQQIFGTVHFSVFYYHTDHNVKRIKCGTVIISDRFLLAAAHCFVFSESSADSNKRDTILIRDGTKYAERLLVRRTFLHPDFQVN
jgi:secreted trypsin-like serine protease